MDYLKIWTNFREIIKPLSDAEKGRLFDAMLLYADNGTEPEIISGNERFIWPVAKRDIDMAMEKSEKNSENGKKGGRPPKNKENETEPEETEENRNKPNETEKNRTEANERRKEKKGKEIEKKGKETENIVPLKRFVPPTIEEVVLYCTERHNHVDASKFVDYYTANGWKVGKSSMKDWKAAIRTWERSEYTEKDYQYDRYHSGLPY